MVEMSAGQLAVRMDACWVDWSVAPTAQTRVETMVAQMAGELVAEWVASMVERMAAMSDSELVVRMVACWVDS